MSTAGPAGAASSPPEPPPDSSPESESPESLSPSPPLSPSPSPSLPSPEEDSAVAIAVTTVFMERFEVIRMAAALIEAMFLAASGLIGLGASLPVVAASNPLPAPTGTAAPPLGVKATVDSETSSFIPVPGFCDNWNCVPRMPATPTAEKIFRLDSRFSFLVDTTIEPQSKSSFTLDLLGSSAKSDTFLPAASKGSWENSRIINFVCDSKVITVPLDSNRTIFPPTPAWATEPSPKAAPTVVLPAGRGFP